MSLRELLAAPEGCALADVAWEELVSVPPTADRAEVARVMSDYDLVAVPVVDEPGRRARRGHRRRRHRRDRGGADRGRPEARRHAAARGAVLPGGFWSIARKRGGWLILLFIEEMFTGTALRHYEATLASAIALTFFIPLIISSGGNSGSQSATLITRALAVGDVEMRDAMRVFLRELGQGLVLGAFLGAIGFRPRAHVGERDGRWRGSSRSRFCSS